MRFILLAATALLAWPALADNHETKTYVYGTYSNCDLTGEEAADKTFEKHYAKAYDALVESGDIQGWGLNKHNTGGHWRRLSYHTVSSVEGAFAATKKYGDLIQKDLPVGKDNYAKACHTHEDYIWEMQHGNAADERGTVGLSVYMVCSMSDEERVDEIVANTFAPVYDEYVEQGKLTSWGWLSHVMGGKYRRLSTISAKDVPSLMKARAELLERFAGTSASREFTSICGSHEDYLWDLALGSN